jgi:CubicO group peptidase (beta-lactamase class C family)
LTRRAETIEGPQHPNRQGYDPFTLQELMTRHYVPGLSIAVIEDFKIHWARGYGCADEETGAKVDIATLFQAASISKPVAAMGLVKAAQDGRFSLDDDINELLRSWKLPEGPFTRERRVTPRMLASHTAGLGDGFGFPGYDPQAPLPTVVQILDGEPPCKTGPVSLERQPLSVMRYSGGGSTILQLALEDVIGLPFEQILRDYVLAPIGMTSSTYEQPLSPARDRHAARGHSRLRSVAAKWLTYPELFAAGMWTTPTDLAKFAIEVQLSAQGRSNRVLSQTMVREMLHPVGIGDFAVGFKIEKRGQGWYFGHGGAHYGFVCLLQAHMLRGHGLVVMANADPTEGQTVIDEVVSRVERAYGWDSLDKPVPQ